MHAATFVSLGGFLAAVAVALGAIGAHVLKSHLTPQQLETFLTAAHYHLLHAVGLVLVGLLCLQRRSPWFDAAGWAMLLGILLFAGCIYLWLATDRKVFVHLVPIGGVSFIVAWLLLAIGALRGLGKG